MLLETVQVLCTCASKELRVAAVIDGKELYKPTHKRHPICNWWICRRPPRVNGFGPNDCVSIGKVRISTRLTFRKRKPDRVFDLTCDDFSRLVLQHLSSDTVELASEALPE
jgi:hypothetical protein